jgi:hypothetical protein
MCHNFVCSIKAALVGGMASYCRCFWANISLWIAFGKGKDFKWVSSYGVSLSIGPPALCLPLVHAFASCDTVLVFRGKGKWTACQAWKIFDDETDMFDHLSETSAVSSDLDMELCSHHVRQDYNNAFREHRMFHVNKYSCILLFVIARTKIWSINIVIAKNVFSV